MTLETTISLRPQRFCEMGKKKCVSDNDDILFDLFVMSQWLKCVFLTCAKMYQQTNCALGEGLWLKI